MRPTSCIVELAAIAKNVRTLAAIVSPTPICAVVKADGYGHGAVQSAQAALKGGATWLAVALVEEGVELRDAGLSCPILILSEPPIGAMDVVVGQKLTPTIYSQAGLDALDSAAGDAGVVAEAHLGVDSGMGRVGVQVDEITQFVDSATERQNISLTAVWTHCPVADEPDNPFTAAQLEQFGGAVGDLVAGGMGVHVANSATAITGQASAAGPPMMVRYGISIYGIAPDDALADVVELQPALSVQSEVSFVKKIAAGTPVGYGHHWTSNRDTTIATVPIGYADGIRRDRAFRGGTVLIGGTHHPIVGVVTMDQMMIDVGPDAEVAVGDEVVVIGRQGTTEILVSSIAAELDTISYEVVCGLSKRIPRLYV